MIIFKKKIVSEIRNCRQLQRDDPLTMQRFCIWTPVGASAPPSLCKFPLSWSSESASVSFISNSTTKFSSSWYWSRLFFWPFHFLLFIFLLFLFLLFLFLLFSSSYFSSSISSLCLQNPSYFLIFSFLVNYFSPPLSSPSSSSSYRSLILYSCTHVTRNNKPLAYRIS